MTTKRDIPQGLITPARLDLSRPVTREATSQEPYYVIEYDNKPRSFVPRSRKADQ